MKRGLKAQVLDLFAPDPSSTSNTSAPSATPLVPPPPPLAKRLNRNALTVAAVIMGMTVIACLVVVRGDSRAATPRELADPTLSEPTSPTFLDRAAVAPSTSMTPTAVTPVPETNAQTARPSRVQSSGSPRLTPNDARIGDTTPTNGSSADFAPDPSRATVSQPRAQAFSAALRHSAVARTDGGAAGDGAAASGITPSGASLAADEAHLIAYGDSVMHSANQPAAATMAPAGGPSTSPRRAFMQQAGDLGGRSALARLEPAGTPYVLRAGTVIPAILLTAITSDLPGDCMGQVSRDVYDSQTQRILLVPKGSKLMCRYDDQVAAGQGRLLVAWTRLMLPDGRSMTLPGLALKDAQGQTGAKGDVDNHTRRVFGRALLLSAIGAGAQLSQPRQASILAAPTTGQVMAGAVGQEMSNVALEVLRRGMDQPPTITVPQGQTFNVFLNGDLVFDGAYDHGP